MSRKNIWRVGALLVVAVAGLGAYDVFRAGLHTRPEMPDGAFSLSYKNGLRAVLVDVPDERAERKYLGLPLEVPRWYEDAWSFCTPPKATEKFKVEDLGPGSRLDAVCRLDVDGAVVYRGLIYTVPKLD